MNVVPFPDKGVAMALQNKRRNNIGNVVVIKGTGPKKAPPKAQGSRKPPGANSSEKSQSN